MASFACSRSVLAAAIGTPPLVRTGDPDCQDRTDRMRSRSTSDWFVPAAVAVVLLGTALPAAAQDTDRWQALFAAVPALPATSAEAVSRIRAQTVDSRVRIDIADPTLRQLQRQVDDLYEPVARQSAAQMQQRLREIENDPGMKELARKLDRAMPPSVREDRPPTLEEMKAMKRAAEDALGPCATEREGCPAPPLSSIASYRMELQRVQPRIAQFHQQLFEQQRRHAQLHAEVDRSALTRLGTVDAASVARDAVARHHELARQQLADAAVLFVQAHEAVRPRFARMAELAKEAEQRGATPAERVQAYALFKSYIEFLLTLQRETLQDVGFWAAVRVRSSSVNDPQASGGAVYELSLAPAVALRGDGVLPTAGPHYPGGRAIVVGQLPGIR